MPPASWHTSNMQAGLEVGRPQCRAPSRPDADVAQLAEQLFCKQQVRSSSLLVGSQKATK